MPSTRSIRVGPMPIPVGAPEAMGLDDVTNGYVPWSRSSIVAWALEQHALAGPQRLVDEQRRIADERRQPVGERRVLRPHLLEVERLHLVDPLEPEVLLRKRDLDLLPQ